MSRVNAIIILALSIVFSSCDSELFIPKDTDEFAQNYIRLIRNGEFDKAIKSLDATLAKQDTHWLSKVSDSLNQGEEKSLKIVGSNVFRKSGKTRTGLTYELEFPNKWLLVEIDIEKVNDKQSIIGLRTHQLQRPLEELNSLSLQGKEFKHYVFLLLAILIVGFTIFVLILCIRTKIAKKWAWILFIFVGFGKI
jgi:hypothetical protein